MTTHQKTSSLFIPVDPVPASRPKVSKFGTYYSKTYTAWRKAAATFVKSALENHEPETETLIVTVDVIRKKPRTSKRDYPIGDVDNYVKAVLDVLNEAAWVDDDQILHITATKRFAEPGEQEGTLVSWKAL